MVNEETIVISQWQTPNSTKAKFKFNKNQLVTTMVLVLIGMNILALFTV